MLTPLPGAHNSHPAAMGKSSKSDRKKDAKHKKKASSSRAKHSKRKRSDTGSSDSVRNAVLALHAGAIR